MIKKPYPSEKIVDLFDIKARYLRSVDSAVTSALNNAAGPLREKLLVWQKWKALAPTEVGDLSLGSLEELIDGLYTIYAPPKGTNRLGCIRRDRTLSGTSIHEPSSKCTASLDSW